VNGPIARVRVWLRRRRNRRGYPTRLAAPAQIRATFAADSPFHCPETMTPTFLISEGDEVFVRGEWRTCERVQRGRGDSLYLILSGDVEFHTHRMTPRRVRSAALVAGGEG
jgi:hypothetical protein